MIQKEEKVLEQDIIVMKKNQDGLLDIGHVNIGAKHLQQN